MRKKEPRYFLSVVEEFIQNPKFYGFRAGRIEIYDRKSKSSYACAEFRFMVPEEFYHGFRETFDMKETDLPVQIDFTMLDLPGEYEKYYGKREVEK